MQTIRRISEKLLSYRHPSTFAEPEKASIYGHTSASSLVNNQLTDSRPVGLTSALRRYKEWHTS